MPPFRERGSHALPFAFLVLAVAPSVAWILIDKTVWPYDQAWYGQVSVELFASLIRSPADWLTLMVHAFGIKAPGIAWLGQLFVPLGLLIGSIELGLQVSILATQLTTLGVLFVSFRALAGGRNAVALAACASVASAPLFVAMSHQYFVEPLQTLAVAWFITLAAFGHRLSRPALLTHLVAATSVAMLAKVSSPLYCAGPGLIASAALFTRRPSAGSAHRLASERARILAWLGAVAAAVTAAGTVAWYAKNFDTLSQFVVATSSGSVAADYGVSDTFSHKFVFWLDAARQNFLLPQLTVVVALVIVAGALAVALTLRRNGLRCTRLDACAAVAVLELLVVLATFSLQINQEVRYLLPAAPYLALLLAWALARLDMIRITQLVALLFTVQWAVVYGQALGLTAPNGSISPWLLPARPDPSRAREVEAAVALSCNPNDVGRYNIVGVELPWFNSNSLSFYASKLLLAQRGPCYYTSLGYAEADTGRAWSRLLSLRVEYYLTVDPASLAIPGDQFNRVTQTVLQRVETSGLFEPVPLTDHPDILILKSKDPT